MRYYQIELTATVDVEEPNPDNQGYFTQYQGAIFVTPDDDERQRVGSFSCWRIHAGKGLDCSDFDDACDAVDQELHDLWSTYLDVPEDDMFNSWETFGDVLWLRQMELGPEALADEAHLAVALTLIDTVGAGAMVCVARRCLLPGENWERIFTAAVPDDPEGFIHVGLAFRHPVLRESPDWAAKRFMITDDREYLEDN